MSGHRTRPGSTHRVPAHRYQTSDGWMGVTAAPGNRDRSLDRRGGARALRSPAARARSSAPALSGPRSIAKIVEMHVAVESWMGKRREKSAVRRNESGVTSQEPEGKNG